MELEHFYKHFLKVKNKKKSPAGKHFRVFFSQILLKICFEWKFNLNMDAVKVFFLQKQGTFFFGGGEAGLPPAP